jgi:hypothetical protein
LGDNTVVVGCFSDISENMAVSMFKAKWLNSVMTPIFTDKGHEALGNYTFWLVNVWPIGKQIRIQVPFQGQHSQIASEQS